MIFTRNVASGKCDFRDDYLFNMSLRRNRVSTLTSPQTKNNPGTTSPVDFKQDLKATLIQRLTAIRGCGLSWPMINDFRVVDVASEKRVKFNLRAVINSQEEAIRDDYIELIHNKNVSVLTVDGVDYVVNNTCTQDCWPAAPVSKPDNSGQVTWAVVLTCLALFVVVVVLVVLYMKNKYARILRFRKAKLDDYNDDLISDLHGDMDDFVGSSSEGPTFSTNRTISIVG